MSFVKGVVSGLSTVGKKTWGGITSSIRFGDYVGESVKGSRMKYLERPNGALSDLTVKQQDEVITILNQNPEILDDLVSGVATRRSTEAALVTKFDDAKITGVTKSGNVRTTKNRNLAKSIINETKSYHWQLKAYKIGGGTVFGGAAVVVVVALVGGISNILGGILDGIIDKSLETEPGTYMLMAFTIMGAILTINFLKETIS